MVNLVRFGPTVLRTYTILIHYNDRLYSQKLHWAVDLTNEGIMHGCQKVLENITSGYGNHEKNIEFITSGRRPRVINSIFFE